MEVQELVTIYSNPEFLDAIIELLGLQEVHVKASIPEDTEADEVTRRVQWMILRRMKQREAEAKG